MPRPSIPPGASRRTSHPSPVRTDKVNRIRIDRDTMGPITVPMHVYYGAHTARTIVNFPISGIRFPRSFIRALGLIKWAAARVNASLGLLERTSARAIQQAAKEVMDGQWDEHFPLDIFQTGSGTSTNINANEVIANRASEILTGDRSSRKVHPLDQVNMGQSSNDVIPTAMHLAAIEDINNTLLPSIGRLHRALRRKAKQFDAVVKVGRTHLQDAVPIRLGQEFEGYARQMHLAMVRARHAQTVLAEVALGGTAVGTGLNAHPKFTSRSIAILSKALGYPLRRAVNHFEAQSAQDSVVEASGCLRTIAVSLIKIANDLRWMGSGPRCGLGEIRLPEVQPGSSIMPGKVNPVIAESVIMAGTQVVGNDTTVTLAGQAGTFELLVMMPVLAHNLLQSIDLLGRSADNFSRRCVEGLTANKEICESFVEKSLAMATALVPVIGYESAAALARESFLTGETIRELARRHKIVHETSIAKLLDPTRMTGRSRSLKSKGNRSRK